MACLLVLAGVAHAQPSDTESVTASGSADRAYLAAGVASGADSAVDWMYFGAQLDGGYRVSERWWLHGAVGEVGRVGYGPVPQDVTIVSPKEHALDARVGFEARGCHTTTLCAFAGVDAGYRIGTARGESIDSWLVVPRAGLDLGLGSRDLRFRPGVELRVAHPPAMDSDVSLLPSLGIGLTADLAYRF